MFYVKLFAAAGILLLSAGTAVSHYDNPSQFIGSEDKLDYKDMLIKKLIVKLNDVLRNRLGPEQGPPPPPPPPPALPQQPILQQQLPPLQSQQIIPQPMPSQHVIPPHPPMLPPGKPIMSQPMTQAPQLPPLPPPPQLMQQSQQQRQLPPPPPPQPKECEYQQPSFGGDAPSGCQYEYEEVPCPCCQCGGHYEDVSCPCCQDIQYDDVPCPCCQQQQSFDDEYAQRPYPEMPSHNRAPFSQSQSPVPPPPSAMGRGPHLLSGPIFERLVSPMMERQESKCNGVIQDQKMNIQSSLVHVPQQAQPQDVHHHCPQSGSQHGVKPLPQHLMPQPSHRSQVQPPQSSQQPSSSLIMVPGRVQVQAFLPHPLHPSFFTGFSHEEQGPGERIVKTPYLSPQFKQILQASQRDTC